MKPEAQIKRTMQWRRIAEELHGCIIDMMNDGARYPDPVTGEEMRYSMDPVRLEEAIKSFNVAKGTP